MKRMSKEFCLSRVIALVAAVMLGTSGTVTAQTPVGVQVAQTSSGYVAGTTLAIECTITCPAGRQLQSLLWTPSLPDNWTLVKTLGATTGPGNPVVDPDGLSVLFKAAQLPATNSIIFQYTVHVPAGAYGERIIGGTLEYQLDGMANPVSSSSLPLVLTDVDAAHSAIGYLAGQALSVTCTFSRPAGAVLQSLLWRPVLPFAEWELVSVSGDGTPRLDADGEAIVLKGSLTAEVLSFSFTVNVPANTTGPQNISGIIEYQLQGMANPVTTRAEPDPLVVRPLHTLQVASAYGTGQPAAGLYTNYYGTVLTNRMSASATAGAYTYGCAGWLLSGNEPVTGTGTECQLALTNNAALTWAWLAPAVGPRAVNEQDTLGFQATVSNTVPGFQAIDLRYSLDVASRDRGMTITPSGLFSWPTDETHGGQTYSVIVTVTDSGAEPHGLNASEIFTVTVAEVNRPPTLGALSDQLADAQSVLSFTATASDPDAPAQALTFSLDTASYDAGMRIDPTNGVFTWAPSLVQAVNGQVYTVQVTVTDNGANSSNLSDTRSFTIGVADSRGTHESAGYLAGRTAEIACTFAYPSDKTLLSLLWRPRLPADDWTLLSATGDNGCKPRLDLSDGTIVFTGAGLGTATTVTFRYTVGIPAGVTGTQLLHADAEYVLAGMANPYTIQVNPDPLPLLELHTLEVVSAEGQCVPAVGVYTNRHGTNLSASVATPLTVGTRTFACTGWTLAETNLTPVADSSSTVSWVLTNDVVLTWNWVAPLITPSNAVTVVMDEDHAPTAWLTPAALTASEPYRPSLESGLQWSLLFAPSNGAATVNGTGATPAITYTPSTNWFGSDSFTVQVTDGLGGFDHVAVNVSVNPVNDAPVLAAIGAQRTDIFTPLTFTATATDTEADALTFSLDEASIAAGMRIDPSTGVFGWTPSAGQAGMAFAEFSVTVKVTDNGAAPDNQSDSETVLITLDSSRATHAVSGYVAGQTMTVDCTFECPAAGRQLQSLLWRPELPAGWSFVSASGDGNPNYDVTDGTLVLRSGNLSAFNPVRFSYVVLVPPGVTGTNAIGGQIEYQLNGMANPTAVRAQPDPLIIPMLLTLPDLTVSDKVYDGLTNATVSAYGTLYGLMAGHTDVSLVTTGTVAFFESPGVGQGKSVGVGGLALEGADAAWYAISTQVVSATITPRVVTVGGTFTVQDKTYDGTVNAVLSGNSLTLATPVAGDDVTLNAVAVFNSAAVGTGKTVSLSGASALSGSAASNYTLSLAGAPTATGTILVPAITATQACLIHYKSPSQGLCTLSNRVEYPAGNTLVALTWRPVLPPGWTVYSVTGNGSPTTDGTNIVFTAVSSAPNPVAFTYTLSVPGGASGTNSLDASLTFRLASMGEGVLTLPAQPQLPLKRYHSADYQTMRRPPLKPIMAPDGKIDSVEMQRVLLYWSTGSGDYHVANVATNTPDGFEVGASGISPWFHNVDYQTMRRPPQKPIMAPDGKIDSVEMQRVLLYWSTGGDYHVTNVATNTPDGYEVGPQ